MAKFQLVTKSFKDKISGEVIEYERLQCKAFVNGKIRTLELKLDNSDIIAVESLLNSDDEKQTILSHKAIESEITDFLKENNDPEIFNLDE